MKNKSLDLLIGQTFYKLANFFFIGFTLFFLPAANSQIFINEFQASNNTSVPEMFDFSDYPDWIELYNSGDEEINLENYTLTDDQLEPEKWTFPSISIPPKGFLHLWTDGYDAVPGMLLSRPWHWVPKFTTIYYHVPFKLSKNGEEIALFDPQGELVDVVVFGPQLADVSFGRQPDGSDNWFFFGDPTPNMQNNTTAYTDKILSQLPEIVPPGGFYSGALTVTANSPNPVSVLRFTTDGSDPGENSSIFTDGVEVDESSTFRVKAYDPGKLPAFTESHTYIFDDREFSIPLISITTDPLLLWDANKGIYNRNLKERDIPIRFEYFTDKSTKVLSAYTTLRISGQFSFQFPQKSLTITARSKFNSDYLSYPFFENVDNYDFKSIYLRNSGYPDLSHTFFRDALAHTLIIGQMDIDAQAYQPAATYLNGEFWGIYNIREKLNNEYFAYHHNADPDNIDLLEYDSYSEKDEIIIIEGDAENYLALLDLIESYDITTDFIFSLAEERMDMDEYINYMISEIFVDNINWLHCNVRWWRERKENAKWRWIFLDTDYGFGISQSPSHNILSQVLGDGLGNDETGWSTLVFKRLMLNQSFREEFIQRFAAYLNTTFRSERTLSIIDSLQNKLEGVIDAHIEKWADPDNPGNAIRSRQTWESRVNVMRNFATKRPDFQREHIINQFAIPYMYDLDLSISGGEGIIYINGVKIPADELSGKYFSGIPVRLKALPLPGYRFVGWEDISVDNPYEDTYSENMQITALFEASNECAVLSEIKEDVHLTNDCSYYIARSDIIVHENAKLIIDPGVEIRMPQAANINVFGELRILGNETSPVLIKPNAATEASKWGGISFDNASGHSEISHLELSGATKGNHQQYIGAISAIDSDLTLDNVTIENVHRPFYSEGGNINIIACSFESPYTTDFINIKYADSALIENCDLKGNNAEDTDAIDLDGVNNAVVRGNRIYGFSGFNSDGIDLGENCNNVLIEENRIANISDKGISVGQASTCTIRRNLILHCVQGVGVKDFNSYAFIDQNTFYGNNYAVACFEKNPGYGGGTVEVKNSILSASIDSSFLLDDFSQLLISYSLSDRDELPGSFNIMTDPRFRDEAMMNFELQEDSPCIDSGDPASPKDSDDSPADMGAYTTYTNSAKEYSLVINEINYHSNEIEDDSGDWVEIYNYGNESIDLSNWLFMDDRDDHRYEFAQGVIIQANEFLLLVNDPLKFENVYGDEIIYLDSFPFGFSNKSDVPRLLDPSLEVVDIVKYQDDSPWSEEPDGNGPSLMLIDPVEDNSSPLNWYGRGYPTPGRDNYDCEAKFTHADPFGCSDRIKFTNRSHGIIDSVFWDFDGFSNSEDYDTDFAFGEEGDFLITLEVFNTFGSDDESLEITVEEFIEAPEVVDGFNCGPGFVELHAAGEDTLNWYNAVKDSLSIWQGKTFITPELSTTANYYVASVEEPGCSSDRVAVEAIIYEIVKADFDYTLDHRTVTIENKSSNAFTSEWDFGDGTIENDNAGIVTHTYDEDGSYTIILYTENESGSCNDTIDRTILIDLSSTKDKHFENGISVYPNPVTGLLNIYFERSEAVEIELCDANAKRIPLSPALKSGNEKHIVFDMNDLLEGFYFLKIKSKKGISFERIIKL